MAILPEGFALPPLPYLLALLVALGLVGWGLSRRAPAVTERHVLALGPWMVVGSALHVLFVLDAAPAALRPLLGTPSVYLSVAALVGGLWLGTDAAGLPVPTVLAGAGLLAAVPLVAGAFAAPPAALAVVWPGLALVGAVLATALWFALLRRVRPIVAVTGWAGALALFGHALDGFSTAVGVDVLGFGERTPLSRLIIETGHALTPGLGGGWLFVLVKLAVVGGVVVLLADYVEEDPTEGNLLLGLVAAVGLGPGAHNLVLFAALGGA